jgi:hypothetical protein
MFRSLFRLIALMFIVTGWGLAALSLHVVRTPDKIGLLPKERLGFEDTYVDARSWTMVDAAMHPDLIKRVLEAGKANWFQYLADSGGGDVAQQLSTAISAPPAQKTNSVLGKIKVLFSSPPKVPDVIPQTKAGFDSISMPVDF